VATLDGLRRSGATWQDDGEVVVLGYSQGAAVALALALGATTSWRPRAVVGLASWLPNEPGLEWDVAAAARAGVRVLLVHGRDDEVVPVEQGRSVERLLTRHDADVTWLEIDGGHELGPLLDAARPWLDA
jgi:predicted esterase